MPKLVVTVGQEVKEHAWDGVAECVIGRLKTSTICLSAPGISRQHCAFARGPDGPIVRDLGSSNGTRLNGSAVQKEAALKGGDRIEVGSVLIVYRADEGAPAEPAAAGGAPPTPKAEEARPAERPAAAPAPAPAPTEAEDAPAAAPAPAAETKPASSGVERDTPPPRTSDRPVAAPRTSDRPPAPAEPSPRPVVPPEPAAPPPPSGRLPVDRKCPHCGAVRRYPPDQDPIECGRCQGKFWADGRAFRETPPKGVEAIARTPKAPSDRSLGVPATPAAGPAPAGDPPAEGLAPAPSRGRAAARELAARRAVSSYVRLYGLLFGLAILLAGGFYLVRTSPALRDRVQALLGGPREPDSRPDPDYESFAALRSVETPDLATIAQAYRTYAASHPSSRYAPDAQRVAALLDGARATSGEAAPAILAALRAEAESHLQDGRFDRAASLAGAILGRGNIPGRGSWEEFLATVERRADLDLRSLASRAEGFAEDGDLVEAARVLIEALPRYAGTGAEGRTLDRLQEYVRRLGEHAASPTEGPVRPPTEVAENPEVSPAVRDLGRQARGAVQEMDFERASGLFRQILAQPMPVAERLWWLWFAGETEAVRALRGDVLAASRAGGAAQPVRIALTEALTGRVTGGDDDGVDFVVELPGSRTAGSMRRSWRSLPPAQKVQILVGLGPHGPARLAAAFFALVSGRTDDAHRLLVEGAAAPEEKPLVDTFLAVWQREDIPAGGYVVFEERLVRPEERDATLAERERGRQEAQAALAAAAEARAQERYRAILQRARHLLDEGLFEEGRQVAGEVARRAPADVAAEARSLAGSVVLRRRALCESGPGTNRLDFYILGDGYTPSNDRQRQFDRSADEVLRTLMAADPWKEYAAFINVYALNLASREDGISREPGGVRRDTALLGVIDGGTYTADPGRAMSMLEAFENDGQAICIGNDEASVSTGGGGVVSCCKGSLDAVPHEIGHAIAGLGDEYTYDVGTGRPQGNGRSPTRVPTEVLAPNLVRGNDADEMRRLAPWAHWIGNPNWTGQTCDLFEGGNYTPYDVWRPMSECLMEGTSGRFCCRCMEVVLLSMYRFVRPIDEVSPPPGEVRLGSDPLLLRARTLRPATHDLEVRWTIRPATGSAGDDTSSRGEDARPLSGERLPAEGGVHEVLRLSRSSLDPGRYVVTLEVHDPTPWVRQDPGNRLTDRRSWTVVVE